jgi:hypothetical protein
MKKHSLTFMTLASLPGMVLLGSALKLSYERYQVLIIRESALSYDLSNTSSVGVLTMPVPAGSGYVVLVPVERSSPHVRTQLSGVEMRALDLRKKTGEAVEIYNGEEWLVTHNGGRSSFSINIIEIHVLC